MPNAVEVANLTNPFDPQDVDPRPYLWLKNGQIVEGTIDEGDIGHLTTLVYHIKAQSNCPPIMVRVAEGGYVVESFFATCTAPMIHLNPGESPATNRVFCIIPNGRTNFMFRVADGGTVWENENPDEYGADIVLTHAPAILDLDAGVPEASEETVGFLLASKNAHADAQRRALSIHGPENTWGFASNVVLTYDTTHLQIYDEEDNVLASGTQFYEGDYIPALEVEGLAHSGAMRDAWINVAATGVPVSDRVTATILKADIGTVLPLADRTLHPDAAREPLLLKQTLPADWNGLMQLELTGAVAFWTPTGGMPIVLSETVFTNAQLPQTIYLEGDGCGTNEAVFSVVGLSDCKTNLALSIFGVNATLAGVNEADEESPGGFIAGRTVHTNAPRTMPTLEACGQYGAPGNLILTWDSSVVNIYTAPSGGTALTQFVTPFHGFNGMNLYVEGISPGTTTLCWSYSGQPNCTDNIQVSVIKIDSVDVHSSDTDTHKIPAISGAAHDDHFVCVKDTGDVVLNATVLPSDPAVLDQLVWEADGATITYPAVGTDKRTAKLSSSTSTRIPVRIKVGGSTCWKGLTWVVWSTISSSDRPIQYSEPVNIGGRKTGAFITGGYNFTHTISPATIISDSDRPNLAGANTVAPPGGNHWTGDPLSGGADKKWDNSRQIRAKKINPAGIADTDFTQPPPPASISYPGDDVEGNDDRSTGDENNDPYTLGGMLLGTDSPGVGIAHSAASDDDTFEWRLHFREFTRLELNGTWERISDDYLWRIHLKFRKNIGIWVNDSSDKALDNSGF